MENPGSQMVANLSIWTERFIRSSLPAILAAQAGPQRKKCYLSKPRQGLIL